MRILERFFPDKPPLQESGSTNLIESLTAQVEMLKGRVMQLSDLVPRGWDIVYGNVFNGRRDLDRVSLDTLANQGRLFYFKNPLIKRVCQIISLYTWAKGITIKAQDDIVNTVLQKFLNDPKNIPALTGHLVIMQLDTEISLHGNLFIGFFVDTLSKGRVICRTFPFDEIREIFTDPEDSKTPRFYVRQYQKNGELVRVIYPDYRYNPHGIDRVSTYQDLPVDWSTSVFHIKTNCLSDMLWGVPEIWASMDYANAYREFLQDWSKFVKALSKFAWQAKTKGGQNAVTALARGLKERMNPTDKPAPVGGVLATNDNISMEPVKVAGAAVSVDDARRLMLMVSSASGVSEIYLSGDAKVGNHATSKTMERPLEMQIQNRQEMWKFVFGEIMNFVIDQAATAPNGLLSGIAKVTEDEYGDEVIILKGEEDDISRSVDITFPPVLDSDPASDIASLVSGATLNGQPLAGTIDLKTVAAQIFRILNIDNAESILAQLFPDGQEPIFQTPSQKTAADVALLQAQQPKVIQQVPPGNPAEPQKESTVDQLIHQILNEAGIEYQKLYASA